MNKTQILALIALVFVAGVSSLANKTNINNNQQAAAGSFFKESSFLSKIPFFNRDINSRIKVDSKIPKDGVVDALRVEHKFKEIEALEGEFFFDAEVEIYDGEIPAWYGQKVGVVKDGWGYPVKKTAYNTRDFKSQKVKKRRTKRANAQTAGIYEEDPETPGMYLCRQDSSVDGYFKAYFEDIANGTEEGYDDPSFGVGRVEATCEALDELGVTLKLENTNAKPEILFYEQTFLGSNVLAAANTYYAESFGYNGGFLFQHIMTGEDPHPEEGVFDAFVYTNFYSPTVVQWDVDTGVLNSNSFDFKTVIVHELVHALGFGTFFNPYIDDAEQTSYVSKTLFQQNLRIDDEHFLHLTHPETEYYQGELGTPTTTIMQDSIVYLGEYPTTEGVYSTGVYPVFSPANYSGGSSLSHLDQSRTNGKTYLMHPAISRNMEKTLHEDEEKILCDIGYAVDGAGDLCDQSQPIAYDDTVMIQPGDDFACADPLINDLPQTAANNSNPTVVNSFSYDEADNDIENVLYGGGDCPGGVYYENLFGNVYGINMIFDGSISSSKHTTYNIKHKLSPSGPSRISEDADLRFILCDDPYNFICNEGFEYGPVSEEINLVAPNHLLSKGNAYGWEGMLSVDLWYTDSNNTLSLVPTDATGTSIGADLSYEIDTDNKRMMGFIASYNDYQDSRYNEAVRTQLKFPLSQSATYSLSLEALKTGGLSVLSGATDDYGLKFYLSAEPLAQQDLFSFTDMVHEELFDQYLGYLPVDADLNEWMDMEIEFNPNIPGLQYLYIFPEISEDSDFSQNIFTYTHVDNVVLKKLNMPERDLVVEKTVSKDSPEFGQEIEFTINVTNQSDEPITDVKTRDYYPDGFVVTSTSAEVAQDVDGFMEFDLFDLDGGENTNITINGYFEESPQAICVPFANVAVAFSTSYDDPTPENNYVDVYHPEFPFTGEIENYSGAAWGNTECRGLAEGKVFEDVNLNGFQDFGELGLADFIVSLYKVENDEFAVNSQAVTQDIENLGVYSFANLVNGEYAAVLSNTNIFESITTPDSSGFDFNGISQAHFFSIEDGQEFTNLDIGISMLEDTNVDISGTVFMDINQNSTLDSDEFGLFGYTVKLFKMVDEATGYQVVGEQETQEDGLYEFNIVDNGDYAIEINQDEIFSSIVSPVAGDVTVDWTNQNYTFSVDSSTNNLSSDIALYDCPCGDADLNGDCIVNTMDTLNFLAYTGLTEEQCSTGEFWCLGDFDQDNIVGYSDSLTFLSSFGCPSTAPFAISGYIFNDENGNGNLEESENAFDGYIVELYKEINGEYILFDSAETDGTLTPTVSGAYVFHVAQEGNYAVVLNEEHSNIELTVPGEGSLTLENSNNIYFVTVIADGTYLYTDRNFGLADFVCGCGYADLTGDCVVNTQDLLLLQSDFSCTSSGDDHCVGDMNLDNETNTSDLILFLPFYGCTADTAYLWQESSIPNLPLEVNNPNISVESGFVAETEISGDVTYNYVVTVTNNSSSQQNNVEILGALPSIRGGEFESFLSTFSDGVSVTYEENLIQIDNIESLQEGEILISIEYPESVCDNPLASLADGTGLCD